MGFHRLDEAAEQPGCLRATDLLTGRPDQIGQGGCLSDSSTLAARSVAAFCVSVKSLQLLLPTISSG